MRPLVVATGVSLSLHAALLGRPNQLVQAKANPGMVWLASPATFTGPRGGNLRGFSRSLVTETQTLATGRPLPQWRSLGDVVAEGNIPPSYPAEALAREWEGVVRLLVEFDESGGATAVEVSSSSGHGVLDEAAVQAARRWRLSEKGPKRSLIVPVSFELSDEGY